MAENKEALDKLPNDEVRAALIEIIESNIPSKNYKVKVEDGSLKGDNYIGIVHRIIVSYNNDQSEPKEFQIFVKVPPTNLARREQFLARPCFLREALMYDEYLPLLDEFQRSKGIIPEEEGFNQYPMSYKTLTEDFKEAIFMEDLSAEGFEMFDRFQIPPVDVIKMCVRTLGKYHALSFAVKDQWPDRFAKFKEIKEIFARDNPRFEQYIDKLVEMSYDALSGEENEKNLKRLKEIFEKKSLFKHMMHVVDGTKTEQYAIVCHGDCWNNNVLYKFREGKPVDIRLLDWQIARYASPMCDLVHYLFCITDKALRDKHLADIMDLYYSVLSSFMKTLGSDPETIFPRSAFEEELKARGIFAIVMGLMVLPPIMLSSDEMPDLDDISERLERGDEEVTFSKTSAGALTRIRDLVNDLFELGYIH